jgi:hypothetical protein
MPDEELITIKVPSETRRRLAILGFPHDLEVWDVATLLIEEGLAFLEELSGVSPTSTTT